MHAAHAPQELIDSPYALRRLIATLLVMTLGATGMYVVSVVLPQVQADFGVSRSDASLPYTLLMVGFGVGGLWMGRISDRHGVHVALMLGAAGTLAGFVWASYAQGIWSFALAHGVMLGFLGAGATFAPLVADTSLWWNRRRGIAVAVCTSGNYLAGAIWPPLAQFGVSTVGWRQTYLMIGVVCGAGMLLPRGCARKNHDCAWRRQERRHPHEGREGDREGDHRPQDRSMAGRFRRTALPRAGHR